MLAIRWYDDVCPTHVQFASSGGTSYILDSHPTSGCPYDAPDWRGWEGNWVDETLAVGCTPTPPTAATASPTALPSPTPRPTLGPTYPIEACVDNNTFRDARGFLCTSWQNDDCNSYFTYSEAQLAAIRAACPVACLVCTPVPTAAPATTGPSAPPTQGPTLLPSAHPSASPTALPTVLPSVGPTTSPTASSPTASPTITPSFVPTYTVAPTTSGPTVQQLSGSSGDGSGGSSSPGAGVVAVLILAALVVLLATFAYVQRRCRRGGPKVQTTRRPSWARGRANNISMTTNPAHRFGEKAVVVKPLVLVSPIQGIYATPDPLQQTGPTNATRPRGASASWEAYAQLTPRGASSTDTDAELHYQPLGAAGQYNGASQPEYNHLGDGPDSPEPDYAIPSYVVADDIASSAAEQHSKREDRPISDTYAVAEDAAGGAQQSPGVIYVPVVGQAQADCGATSPQDSQRQYQDGPLYADPTAVPTGYETGMAGTTADDFSVPSIHMTSSSGPESDYAIPAELDTGMAASTMYEVGDEPYDEPCRNEEEEYLTGEDLTAT